MEDYPKLDKVLAAFYEALRLFRKSTLLCFHQNIDDRKKIVQLLGIF